MTAVSVRVDLAIEYLRIDGETVETTPDHRFLTDHGWVEAGALWPGTRIQRLDGSYGMVEGFRTEIRPVVMWDLTVQGVHTFAVGEGEWVVHNKDCVIGGMEDLEGGIKPWEHDLRLKLTPSLGNTDANWARNERVLLREMDLGDPIRDASIELETGALRLEGAGQFINRERTLLRQYDWTYDPTTGYWYAPPGWDYGY